MNDKDIKQTIEFWESWLNQKKTTNIGEFMIYGGRSLDVCKKYLQEKAARENPKPLTLEQLKERMGKAVYITDDYNVAEGWYVVGSNDWYADGYGDLDAESLCGIMWKAYDHEPKEA